ncbi:ATP-dependent DNA helicase RecQ [Weissella confusa]|uniref:RecQ family ATP-dependent DNA helicase n=1 Tax=Weissella confusa TaxID=1583 RepID=UPI001899EE88|nr:RecQ family ATP-dependent DNA helicase [Weissella confusa]MBJ7616543.1 ATP-dependent DNA helicase RecQ [Weissella confusa]MBJ7627076.1 ATP-dependent DNA helicase RecQ [Weissella confusa]MCT8392583.1 ATP-dependent DNA helicase RecQ [Weissella confusa]MDY2512781.1 RecQ family ATP-dependent DNA helicase [Weissella confusa]WEY48162.1 RecQ family ATP-dependent DNA helicase [Weissella confusa]
MDKTALTAVLKEKFGFDSFKPGQAEVLEALTAGKNTLAMLPTGGGKSLIYQMMGNMRDGLVIIVTPLLSLMQDQVARLNYAGEPKVVALNSTLPQDARRTILRSLDQYKFLFVSPEMLGQTVVQSALRKVKINLLVVDEAHTIVSWGPDFRPDYLALPQVHKKLGQPQLLLLTATATPKMMTDITVPFGLPESDWFIYRQSVDRPNIYLHTETLANEGQKRERLADLVRQLQGPGIVYFSSRKLATSMADWLAENTGRRVAAYHAGLDTMSRYRIQQQFMLGQIDVIAATSAFGMGIDKDNVRYVIHYHLSNDLANYLQEIGRAGRDGEQSVAILLYVPGDENLQLNMIDGTIPNREVVMGYYDKRFGADEIGRDKANLLDFYAKQGMNPDEVATMFETRRQQRQQDLYNLVNYAKSDAGLRRQLLDHFGDDAQSNDDAESVGVVDWHPEKLALVATEAPTELAGVTDWRTQVAKLFNLG